jgi:hypothetical protein
MSIGTASAAEPSRGPAEDAPPVASPMRSPFPGPRPYAWSEADLLFGRNKEVTDLRDLVGAYRAALLYSQSGVGKSSLIAKLGQTLVAEGATVLTARVGITPDRGALGDENAFTRSVLSSLTFGDGQLALDEPAAEAKVGLIDGMVVALKARGLLVDLTAEPRRGPAPVRWTTTRPCILVLDQFEELFTTNLRRWPQRRTFVEELSSMLKAIDDVNLLLAIREDRLAELDPYASLFPQALRIRYRLERLRKESALQVIREPLLRPPLAIEVPKIVCEEIVANLLKTKVVEDEREASQPGASSRDELATAVEIEGEFVEPLHLQLACFSLWQALESAHPVDGTTDGRRARDKNSFLFERGGQNMVATSNVVGDIDGVLRATYDRAVTQACARGRISEPRLRWAIEKRLITRENTRGFVDLPTLQRSSVSGDVVDALIDGGIVRREPRAGTPWFELTHDRLIGPILDSNVRARQRRTTRRRAIGALGVLAVLVLVSTVAILRAQRRAMQQLASARSQLVNLETSASARRPSGSDFSSGETDQADDVGDYGSAIKALEHTLADKQKQIDTLQTQNTTTDSAVRELKAQLATVTATPAETRPHARPPAPSPIPQTLLLPTDIKPHVSAPAVSPKQYAFSISLQVPPNKVGEIQRVDYRFNHKSFGDHNTATSMDASNGFHVGYRGWGCLTSVTANVILLRGDPITMNIDMCALLGW